jgi:hypothetical protein
LGDDRQSLYEGDFCLWLEQQAPMLREARYDDLDLADLIEEIEAMGRKDKKAIKSNLVVLLTHLLKHQLQPEERSSGCRGPIIKHRQRLRDDFGERARACVGTRPAFLRPPTLTPASGRAPRPGCRCAPFPSPAPIP